MYLNKNELTEIRRRTFDGLAGIANLLVGDNKIESIENDALDLLLLETLDLDKNKLKRLSDVAFDRLPKLSVLSLEQNELEYIGASLYDLENIHNISLSENRIQDIDLNAFSKLKNSSELYLYRSGFTFATTKQEDREFSQKNTQLRHLIISGNYLSDASELNKLDIFRSLKRFDLSRNLYENLHVGRYRTLKIVLPGLEDTIILELDIGHKHRRYS